MKRLKLAAGILNQTALDWDQNQKNIERAIEVAIKQQVQVLCLPELCVTGYGCDDAFLSPGLEVTAWQILEEIAPLCRNIVVSVGVPVRFRNALFNCACLIVDGEIVGLVAKRHLAGDGLHYEPRWFKPWPPGVINTIERNGKEIPIGDLHFDVGGVRVGFEICEDAWVSNRPGIRLAGRAVDLILNPSASHFAFGKLEVRKRFVIEGSRAFGATYIYSNLLGNSSGRAVYDGGALIASGGRLITEGSRFSFKDVEVTSAVVDIDLTRTSQTKLGSFMPDVSTRQDDCVRVEYDMATAPPESITSQVSLWETSPYLKEEEFTRAICLALFDYMRKSRSNGFVVSLSGGADSAAVACLCALMVRLAVHELGTEHFAQKLAYLEGGDDSAAVWIERLLVCVYQSTSNSSDRTQNAARKVASAIGSGFEVFDVDALVMQYRAIVEKSLGRELTWETDDVALQNIQARVRAPGVWMLTNIRNALLLSTSNRSEAAVGYATMDGDTCGGLSPIAGIDKAFLRQWLQWLEGEGPAESGPIEDLSVVNAQAPTAELRPPSESQTDEGDLMPYPILDAIERSAIRDKRMPDEVLEEMCVRFETVAPEQMRTWVVRFFQLWSRNQWKRERYAPSFHVDDENLDPKTWCRFPILSGGFAKELRELEL